MKQIIFICVLFYFELGGITKHLMTGPSGNSEFCFPSTSMLPSASPRGTLRVSGKQNSLFPLGPVIKCLMITSSQIALKVTSLECFHLRLIQIPFIFESPGFHFDHACNVGKCKQRLRNIFDSCMVDVLTTESLLNLQKIFRHHFLTLFRFRKK